jgi:hypothetical protein
MRRLHDAVTDRRTAVAVVVAAVAAMTAAATSAHIERASYWPDPAADTSVSPPAGGEVPAARSLFTALRKTPPGDTHVVCEGAAPSPQTVRKLTRRFRAARRRGASRSRIRALKRELRGARRSYRRKVGRNRSVRRLNRSIASARTSGYKVRPTEAPRSLSRRQGRRLRRFNQRLLARCKFHSIQTAVSASGNNDRVVIMPGIYTEPKSRAEPTDDPKCADLKQSYQNDEGQAGAVSYEYQFTCPNDQNLIAVLGRLPGAGEDPQPPLDDRHGIPNLGPCIRCNLQIEGSGVGPDDVVIDAGRVASGNRGPIGAEKHVGIRADRADGFVLRNITVRHAMEHDIYILESDGYRLERFKVFWAGEYGLLTFVEDHGLIQDCEAAGAGDAGLYPGSSADTGDQSVEGRRRLSQELRFCDMHHNALGYSGTDSNAVHVHDNNFYDNAIGFSTDVFTGSGHPGFPQDSDLIEHNNFYSNNFNPFVEGSDVEPSVPAAVGTGMWIPGGNHNVIRDNRFWDNWRRGTMLFAVPDSVVCTPPAHQAGCDPKSVSTSFNNEYYGNVMGRDPAGRPDPNGTDFWWDSWNTNTGNCWHDNVGKDGTAASITSVPDPLPSDCATSRGTGGPEQESELLGCFGDIEFDATDCPWFTTPPEPQP